MLTFQAEEIKDVAALKEHLCEEYGFPVSLQQLLHDGNFLEDGAELAASVDLQLLGGTLRIFLCSPMVPIP